MKGRGMMALAAAALLPLAAACAPGMTSGGLSGTGRADVAAHAFVSAVDAGEIQQGQLAQQRAQNQAVRAYGQRMVADHSNALALREQRMGGMGLSLRAGTSMMAGSEGMSAGANVSAGSGSGGGGGGNGMFSSAMVLSPGGMADLNAVLMANPNSRPVAETAMRDLQMLQQLNGAAFDRAYITRQAEMHQYTLENMDRLLAQPISGDLRTLLTTQRAAVAMHLQMAQQLRGQL
ncbi:MAG TPA: DUF4142 domain-containing protein [Longimicrobium sp.]|nr:DUF4142 domain-containing protein [Longimicrobium sp.]